MLFWIVIRSDDKKRARLNCMRHLLDSLPYDGKDESVVVPPDPMIVGSADDIYESDELEVGRAGAFRAFDT